MSPSALKSETARVNGTLSNGPATAEGKAISSKNATRHGFCSKQIVLPGEDQQEYDRRHAGYIETFQPRTQPEEDLVDTLAATRWRLNRLMAYEAHLLNAAEDTKDILKALSLLTRHQNQLQRTWDKAFADLQLLKQNRVPLKSSTQRNEPKATAPQAQKLSESDIERQILEIMTAPIPSSKVSGGPR